MEALVRLLVFLLLALPPALCCRHRGRSFQNNEQWTEKDVFRMKCSISENGSWKTEVIGCLTPTNLNVPVNGSATEGDHVWVCQIGADGHVSLRQEVNKNAKCQGRYRTGEVWNQQAFEFSCGEGGVTLFLGCRTSSGTLIPVNSTQDAGAFVFHCLRFPNGTVTLLSRSKEKNCLDGRGESHAVGESWVEDKAFVRVCLDNGNATVTHCQHEGLHIPINGRVIKNQLVFHCDYKDNVFKFYTSPLEKEKENENKKKN